MLQMCPQALHSEPCTPLVNVRVSIVSMLNKDDREIEGDGIARTCYCGFLGTG